MINNISDLYKQLSDIMDTGDEKAARAFLKQHLKEFPEDVQKKIVFEFFAEALGKEVENKGQIAQIQKGGMDAIREIDEVEKGLKDQQKLADLRKNLGA